MYLFAYTCVCVCAKSTFFMLFLKCLPDVNIDNSGHPEVDIGYILPKHPPCS